MNTGLCTPAELTLLVDRPKKTRTTTKRTASEKSIWNTLKRPIAAGAGRQRRRRDGAERRHERLCQKKAVRALNIARRLRVLKSQHVSGAVFHVSRKADRRKKLGKNIKKG